MKSLLLLNSQLGFPGGSAGKESAFNSGRPGFDPWVGKILVVLELPTPVCLPGEFHGPKKPGYIVHAVSKSRTRLSN